MKKVQHQLIAFLLLAFISPFFNASAQDNLTKGIQYEVNRVYPPLSITKEKLQEAQTLKELNPYFRPSWIRSYIAVELSTSYQGKQVQARGKDENLSPAQIDLLDKVDEGAAILVTIQYIPENNLTQNDAKEMDFTFTVEPDRGASYAGGTSKLMQYLKDNAIDKIPADSFEASVLAAITFTINESGEVIDAHVFESSTNERVDALLLEAVQNMPCWEPAEYKNGLNVRQDFVLMMGNMESCKINFLNTWRSRRLFE